MPQTSSTARPRPPARRPAVLAGDHRRPIQQEGSFPYEFRMADFLSTCHRCRKGLHGKDIFMYGDEKAFCSWECRQCQICIDELQEKRERETVKHTEISASPFDGENVFLSQKMAA
ncbi:hypothetical protein AXF42_Ash011749 [Apostasia shenzhenica]|uniref:FLZ-type domain-containing protein n=1 Tax=Apostasia shenzhenica TaxID=1088818 RepID=A0A2H9ZUV2_9ASPA|nr:hypothetical protein AXF42_Ash011749 [Apostasia shenzhenica]